MGLSGIVGKLFSLSEQVMFFWLVNIVWMVFNAPILYFSAGLLFAGSEQELYTQLVVIAVLAPFVLMPATAAMYGVIRKKVMGRYEGGMLSLYWRFYRENYRRSLAGGLLLTPLLIFWVVNFTLLPTETGSPLFYVYLLLTGFLLTFIGYFFSDTVHFSLGLFSSLKKCLLMAIGYSHYTIGLLVASGVFTSLLYALHPALLVLFLGSVLAYFNFFSYYQIYRRSLAKMDNQINLD